MLTCLFLAVTSASLPALAAFVQLNLDNTWGTTKEGFELCTVMGSLAGISGSPIASIYVGDKSSATIQRALQWVTDLMARHGILLHPEVVIADDDKGERKAVRLTWPKSQLRCIYVAVPPSLPPSLPPSQACQRCPRR